MALLLRAARSFLLQPLLLVMANTRHHHYQVGCVPLHSTVDDYAAALTRQDQVCHDISNATACQRHRFGGCNCSPKHFSGCIECVCTWIDPQAQRKKLTMPMWEYVLIIGGMFLFCAFKQ